MEDLFQKFAEFVTNIFTYLLRTLIIYGILFCISWYLFTNEFPPKKESVVKYYQQMKDSLKASEELIQKMQQLSAQQQAAGLNTQNPQDLSVPMSEKLEEAIRKQHAAIEANTAAAQQIPENTVHLSKETWEQLNNRLLQIEKDLQYLKLRTQNLRQ